MTVKTKQELRVVGHRGVKVSGIYPGTDPTATETQVVAEVKRIVDDLLDSPDTFQVVELRD